MVCNAAGALQTELTIYYGDHVILRQLLPSNLCDVEFTATKTFVTSLQSTEEQLKALARLISDRAESNRPSNSNRLRLLKPWDNQSRDKCKFAPLCDIALEEYRGTMKAYKDHERRQENINARQEDEDKRFAKELGDAKSKVNYEILPKEDLANPKATKFSLEVDLAGEGPVHADYGHCQYGTSTLYLRNKFDVTRWLDGGSNTVQQAANRFEKRSGIES